MAQGSAGSIMNRPSLAAGGPIFPARFIKFQAGQTPRAVQCVADDEAFGISADFQKVLPESTQGSVSEHALAGDMLTYYGRHEVTKLELAAAVTFGAKLKPDANAKGIIAAATETYSATALSAGAVGDLIDVYIEKGTA